MEIIRYKINDMLDFYNACLEKADPRVQNWPLMSSYTPTWLLTALYLGAVYWLPQIMENRKPVNLGRLLFLYNGSLVALNLYIFVELVITTTRLNYSYSCQPVNYSNDPDEMRVAKALWWYYFSKCLEFLDTIFFILRKKTSQVTVLHVYHHATMFPIWWIGIKWVPGGQSFFGALINSAIHVFMYTYYALTSLGPSYQRFLWWKRYLTNMQMIQFSLGIIHSLQAIYVQCNYPLWIHWALAAYASSIFLFFINFYRRNYLHAVATKSAKASSASKSSLENCTETKKLE